jgi:hypothetical protein
MSLIYCNSILCYDMFLLFKSKDGKIKQDQENPDRE